MTRLSLLGYFIIKCHEKCVSANLFLSSFIKFHSAVSVGWLYWGFTSLQRHFSHIATWKQEITNFWKFKSQCWELNPGPLWGAKSLTTWPPLLPVVSEEKSHMSQSIRGQGGHLCFSIGLKNTKLGRGRWNLASCQVLFKSLQQFQRSPKCLS